MLSKPPFVVDINKGGDATLSLHCNFPHPGDEIKINPEDDQHYGKDRVFWYFAYFVLIPGPKSCGVQCDTLYSIYRRFDRNTGSHFTEGREVGREHLLRSGHHVRRGRHLNSLHFLTHRAHSSHV